MVNQPIQICLVSKEMRYQYQVSLLDTVLLICRQLQLFWSALDRLHREHYEKQLRFILDTQLSGARDD